MNTTVESTLKMLMEDDNKSAAIAVAATSGILLATLVFYSSRQKAKHNPTPPSAPTGLIGCIKSLNDPPAQVPALLKWADHVNFAPAMTVPLIPMHNVVMLSDAKLCHEILTHNSTTKPDVIYKGVTAVRGMSMVGQLDMMKWKHARKGVAPAFSGKNIRRMNDVCHRQTERWIERFLDPLAKSGEEFDPCHAILMLTISVIGEAAFDYQMTDDEIRDYMHDNHVLGEETNKRLTFPARSLFHRFLPAMKQVNESLDRVRSFGQKLLDEHRKLPNPTRNTILDLVDKNQHYEDDFARICDIDLFILAGFETTGYTLTWAIFELARNPEETAELHKALAKLPEDERTSCEELKNFITEVLRVYPSIPIGSARTANRDFKTSDGSVISKGSVVFHAPILIQRNPKVFGEDANVFRPGRWNDASEEMKAAVSPFSVGPQNCVGQALARAELHSVVATVASRYRLELIKDCEPEVCVTYQPNHGKMKVTRI